MATIADNLQAVKARIARAGEATLLAVSKGQGVERVREAAAAGQKAFGENYVQEALQKMDALAHERNALQWHLIGPLQSNKTRVAAERFDWVQTVASEKIAKRLSEQRQVAIDAGRAVLNVLVQVNASGEASKSGIAPEQAGQLCEDISKLKNLSLRGLMAIPEPGARRARYAQIRALYDSLKGRFGFDTLSMGMSDDLELAIAEGATMVRVGTAVFGPRERTRTAA